MAADITLIPQPKSLKRKAGRFALNKKTQIVITARATDEEFRAAESLQAEILKDTGLHISIQKMLAPWIKKNVIVLGTSGRDSAFSKLLPNARSNSPEAYAIRCNTGGVHLGAKEPVGVLRGVQTLRQIARNFKRSWPAMDIDDSPDMPYRGVMLDISRAKVPTLQTLTALADFLAFYKINVFQLYSEHTFQYIRHPTVGRGWGPMSPEDVIRLDRHCRGLGIDLVPCTQAFGHLDKVLTLPEYRHLAESDSLWELNPMDERTYKWLDERFGDLLPCFSSKLFNVSCDETWTLGKGKAKKAVEKLGVGRVYLNHMLRVHKLVKKYGKRMMMWGDIILNHPELAKLLPRDVIILNWWYEAKKHYDQVDAISKTDLEQWVCPGTSTWNSLYARLENANVNIRTFVADGLKVGAQGMLNTEWGDGGHYNLQSWTFYGNAMGAAESWNSGAISERLFDERFSRLEFGPAAAPMRRVVSLLGRAASVDVKKTLNYSITMALLFDEPYCLEFIRSARPESVREVGRLAKQALKQLEIAKRLIPARHGLTWQEHRFSAECMIYASERGKLLKKFWQIAEGKRKAGRKDAASLRKNLNALLCYHDRMVRELNRLWLKRSKPEGFHVVAGRLRAARNLFEKLKRICDTVAKGKSRQNTLADALKRSRALQIPANK